MNSFKINAVLLALVLLIAKSSYGNYLQNLYATIGIMFPANVTAVRGENIYLKLKEVVADQKECLFRAPGSEDIVITPNQRVELWTDGGLCAIKISNIRLEDAGFWRLTSRNDDEFLRGISIVNVVERINEFPVEIADILNFEDLTPEDTSYCYVYRSNNEHGTEIPKYEKCSLPNDALDPKSQGVFNVIAGIKGQTNELTFEINIETKEEVLEATVQKSSNEEIILTCNLRNSNKDVKFCRFLRLDDNYGLHVNEGLGSENFSYIGNGFVYGDCGLSIMSPGIYDKSLWKCYVGVEVDNEIRTIGAILNANNEETELEIMDVNNVQVLHNNQLTLKCNSRTPIDYCWFLNPSGKVYPIFDTWNNKLMNDWEYTYVGSFRMGECGIVVRHANMNDSGIWTCNAGVYKDSKVEAQKRINVRVTESQLVTTAQEQEIRMDDTFIIECLTIPQHVPLEYCRFVAPNGDSFSLNEKATSENPILDNFFFNPNRNLKSGYCSLVVKSARINYSGAWTCAGRLVGLDKESSDLIKINVTRESDLTTAAIIGMAIGALAIAIIVVGVGYYSYNRRRHITELEMEEFPSNSSDNISSSSETGSEHTLNNVQP